MTPPARRHLRPAAGGAADAADDPGDRDPAPSRRDPRDRRSTAATVDLQYKSPLARAQARQDVRETLLWLESDRADGRRGRRPSSISRPTARWLGDRLGVPGHLMRDLEAPMLLAEAVLATLSDEPQREACRCRLMARLPAGTGLRPTMPHPPIAEELELCRAFARCFAGADGQSVLEHLRRASSSSVAWRPNASDAELRHLEGQRYAVAYIVAMVERGRGLSRIRFRTDRSGMAMSEQLERSTDTPAEETAVSELAMDAASDLGRPVPTAAAPARGRARKFWDREAGAIRTDALLKSYLELERKLGSMVPLPRRRRSGRSRASATRRSACRTAPERISDRSPRTSCSSRHPRLNPGCMRRGSPRSRRSWSMISLPSICCR